VALAVLLPGLSFLAGACSLGRSGDLHPAVPRGPNILFIYCDDHAQNAIGAYGSQLAATPNIDRLAAEGIRFANSFVGNSICGPARATVLTGKHSHANGVLQNGMPFDATIQPTFPELLQAGGYQTAIVGKWHLLSDPTGFDSWDVLIGQGPYYNPEIKSAAGTRRIEGYTTEIITDLALQWLEEERHEDRPFLLMVQHKAPHRRWLPGPEQLDLYDDVTMPEPTTLFDDYSGRASGAATQEMTIARHMDEIDLKLTEPGGLTEAQLALWNAAYEPKNASFENDMLAGDALVRWKYQRYIKDYMRCISAVDDSVGRLLRFLEETGLDENTLVVYSSDQGFYLGEHGWYDKRWMYEESLTTPLIARWPGTTPAGIVEERMVQNIDLAPTFLSVADIPRPKEMHGRSLERLLEGRRPRNWRDSIYYRYYEFPGVHAVPRHYGVRTERYKLIYYEQLDEWELFDLAADPRELNSVYTEPGYDDIVAELKEELAALRARYGDQG